MVSQRYATRQDAIEQAIVPALDVAMKYDVQAICDEAFEWRVDTDRRGRELVGSGGFEQKVSAEDFWAIVAKHETARP